MNKPDRTKVEALSKVLSQLKKEKGDIVYTLSDEPEQATVEVVPTGLLGFDVASVIGGIPRGRVIEIYGPEAGGKTTLAVTIAKAFQRHLGGAVFYVDMEHTLHRSLTEAIGVNPDTFVLSRPRTGEEAIELVRRFVRENAVDLVVIDSVPALVFAKEITTDIGDAHVGLLARNLTTSLRVLNAFLESSGVTLILINQLRMKIGGPSSSKFRGPETTTTGGLALKFFASMRIDVRRTGTHYKVKDESVGHRVKITFHKNKFGPLRSVELDLYYGKGFDEYSSLVDTASMFDVVKVSGPWFSYREVKHKGKLPFVEWLKENPDIADAIHKETISLARTLMVTPTDVQHEESIGDEDEEPDAEEE